MGLTGSSVGSPNRHLRMLIVVFFGVLAFGAILYWRQQSLVTAEYVEFPDYEPKQVHKSEMRSQNYQIETQDVTPSVK